MSNIKQVFADNKFPTFITNHAVFRNHKEIKKVFPEIGLPNCEKEIEVDNKKEAMDSAKMLLGELRTSIDERLRTINKFSTKKPDAIGNKRKKKLDNALKLLNGVKTAIAPKNIGKCLISNNGRVTANINVDVTDAEDKVTFKTGEGIFKIYNKLNEVLRDGHFLAMEKIENLHSFKEFSSKNVPSLKYKVRFSSSDSEGLWDIATMSMRGISSCQSWGTGNSTHVIGSMVDPFTGILYLTSGGKFNEYGTKMIRRCIVRFLVDDKKKIPFIALERMYPAMERGSLDAFIALIKERTDNKFEVVYLPECRKASYVPMSKIVNTLTAHDQPYRDSATPYKVDSNDIGGGAKKVFEEKLEGLYSSFASKVVAAARYTKLVGVPATSRPAFKSLRGSDYMWDSSYHFYEALSNDMKLFFNKADISKYKDNNLFLKETIEAFLADKLEDRIYSITRVCADTKVHKKLGAISDEVIRDLAKVSSAKIIIYLTAELKKIKIVAEKVVSGKVDPAESAIPIYTKLLG